MADVRHPGYRINCLMRNQIMFRYPSDPLPDAVAAHVGQMAHTASEAAKLAPDTIAHTIHELAALGMGCSERDIYGCLLPRLFLLQEGEELQRVADANVACRLLPCPELAAAPFPIPQPAPEETSGLRQTSELVPRLPLFRLSASLTRWLGRMET